MNGSFTVTENNRTHAAALMSSSGTQSEGRACQCKYRPHHSVGQSLSLLVKRSLSN